MKNTSQFHNLNIANLTDLVFIAQKISEADSNFEELREIIFQAKDESDGILANIPTLSFLRPHSNGLDEQFDVNNLAMENLRFDGETLSATLFEAEPVDVDNALSMEVEFSASHLQLMTKEYEQDENSNYILVAEDDIPTEEINNILEDFPNIFDIYFSMKDGIPMMHIFLFEDYFDEENETDQYAKIYEISFKFA